MYGGEIIEISSSSEPSPRKAVNTSRSRKTQPVTRSVSQENDVIVLTDSDDEDLPLAVLPITPATTRNSEKAGPSRLEMPSQFVPSGGPPSGSRSQPKAGPSGLGSSASEIPTRVSPVKITNVPLFLPSDDETDPPRANPGPSPEPFDPIPDYEEPMNRGDPTVSPNPDTPPVEANPADSYLARVLEIIPDVQLDHLFALIQKHIPSYQEQTVERVLHLLFEDPTYPKVDKSKRKRVDGEPEGDERGKAKLKVDYASADREYKGGPSYIDLAMEQLFVDFPFIPVAHVRQNFFARNSLYAPTYLFLVEEREKANLPYVPKNKPTYSKSKDKGKGKVLHDAEFESERQWLLDKLQEDTARIEEDENEECDDGIECGCCFSTYHFEKMIQCPEAHLFCKTCMVSYASNLLGAHDPNIVCMDQSGCKLAFTMAELSRFLTPKLYDLYNRVKQRKEIEAAGLENLEECPFCDYKVVIENEQEKLFRCENNDCGAVSCRECKKVDHLPKSCKEMEEDKHLDGRHTIEEAMTRALTRNCPKCQTAFIKEFGCNKMTCPNCNTLSCYVCRQIITGYEHFGNPSGGNKCNVSDPAEQRHNEDITAAAKKALEDYKRDHPDVKEKDIKVDLPPAPPAQFVAAVAYQPALMPPHNVPNGAPPYMPQQFAAPAAPRRPRARVTKAARAPRRR